MARSEEARRLRQDIQSAVWLCQSDVSRGEDISADNSPLTDTRVITHTATGDNSLTTHTLSPRIVFIKQAYIAVGLKKYWYTDSESTGLTLYTPFINKFD